MAHDTTNHPVLVAVDHPERAAQLVRTGSDIAALSGSAVVVITVAVKRGDSPFGVFSDATIIERYAADSRAILARATDVAPGEVEVDGEVLVGSSVLEGINTAVETHEPSAVVVGWDDQRRRRDAILGSTIDRLLERLPCDLYVERIGAEADGVASVLLPVAGGPNVRPAALAAKAIAVRNDASVTVLAVSGGDVAEADATAFREEGTRVLEELPGPTIEVDSQTIDGEHVADEIVSISRDHDVIIFGATRQGALRRRVVGSIPRAVADQTDRSVILGRAGEAVAKQPRGLARVWRSLR